MVVGEGASGWLVISSLAGLCCRCLWSVPRVPWAGSYRGVDPSSGILGSVFNPVQESLHSMVILFQLKASVCPLASQCLWIFPQVYMETSGFQCNKCRHWRARSSTSGSLNNDLGQANLTGNGTMSLRFQYRCRFLEGGECWD